MQTFSGCCFWCDRKFRNGFAAHLATSRPCMILARALVADTEPELKQAANLLQLNADRICSEEFAKQNPCRTTGFAV